MVQVVTSSTIYGTNQNSELFTVDFDSGNITQIPLQKTFHSIGGIFFDIYTGDLNYVIDNQLGNSMVTFDVTNGYIRQEYPCFPTLPKPYLCIAGHFWICVINNSTTVYQEFLLIGVDVKKQDWFSLASLIYVPNAIFFDQSTHVVMVQYASAPTVQHWSGYSIFTGEKKFEEVIQIPTSRSLFFDSSLQAVISVSECDSTNGCFLTAINSTNGVVMKQGLLPGAYKSLSSVISHGSIYSALATFSNGNAPALIQFEFSGNVLQSTPAGCSSACPQHLYEIVQ
jgi:hypothetical protein